MALRLRGGFGDPQQITDESVVQTLTDAVRHRTLIVFRRPREGCTVEPSDLAGHALARLIQGRAQRSVVTAAKPTTSAQRTPSPLPVRAVSSLDAAERFEAVLRKVPPYLPASMRAEFSRLLEPEVLAVAAGVLAVWGAAHFTPVGWIADALMVAAGGVLLGLAAFQAASLFAEAIALTVRAKTDADLELAARRFADAIALVGVAAFVALLVKGGARAARGRVAPGGSTQAPPQATAPTGGAPRAPQASAPSAARPTGVTPPPSAPVASKVTPAAEIAASRRATAEAFYREQGVPKHRIDGHLQGIDFTQPVEVVTLKKGTVLTQYQVPGNPQGNYYAPPGSTPSSLGISAHGLNPSNQVVDKVASRYVTKQDVQVLRSTAKDIVDTWSVKGEEIQTLGGATQYMSTNKSAFIPSGP